MGKAHLKTLFVLITVFMTLRSYALDYPHYGVNNIGCDSCHFVYGSEPSLLPSWTAHTPQDIDDTQYNTLCWSCHNEIDAPYARTHSSLNTTDKYGDADNNGKPGWSLECRTCHNPHFQKQFRTYGSSSYLYSGQVTALTSTTITNTGAGWTTNQWQGKVVVGNTSRPDFNYKILSNTPDTLTVKGPVNSTYVTAGSTFAIVYGKLIKESITTPNSGKKATKFFRETGANSFADGNAVYDGICEVCHTQTIFHKNAAGGDHLHNVGIKCTNCHLHANGFKGAGCDVCHGYPPVVSEAIGGPDGLVNLPGTTGSATTGAHNKHVNVKFITCLNCHYNSVGSGTSHNNGAPQDITIGFYLFGGAYQGGIYNGQTQVTYDSSEPNTIVSNSGSKTCNNIYCHGKFPDGTEWGGGKNTNPQWDGSVTCTSCHDTGGSLTYLGGKHLRHTDESTYAFPCEKCHYETASGSSAIRNETYHVNNTKDLIFAKGGSFDSGTKTCSNTYCHSNANSGDPNIQPQWTSSNSMECDSCHNGRTGMETLEMLSNGHERLVSSQWVRQFPCYYCHDATVDISGNIEDYSRHVNETKDVAIASRWTITGNAAPSFDSETKVCSNVYCHSDGTTVNPQVRPFAWNEGHTKCNSCHGHEKGTCSNCHADGRSAWPAGDEWKAAMPMYSNTGPGTEQANSHVRHLLTDFPCEKCHDNTIVNGSCLECHGNSVPSGSMSEINHINPAYHVNKTKDVAFKGGGTFDAVNKTCSNTASDCHTGSTPKWGETVNNTALICLTCHGTTENDTDDFVYKNGTRAKINMAQWENTGHGRPTSAGNYVSGNPPANFPSNPCWYCHDNKVIHGTETNPFRLKIHPQFEKRFEKECTYCHMERKDEECMGCHNSSFSLAPQLADLASPPLSQDHTGYANGLTSCVTTCHIDNASTHNTSGTITWTEEKKADVRNAYAMMGVCLQCHEDDSNDQCNKCHTGDQYKLGYDPGTGYRTAVKAKATSVHFGYKHYNSYEQNGVWKGGKFCWDCHDPHGDGNIYMVQDKVSTETDGIYGVPVNQRSVSFTRKQSGLDYAKSSAPYNGICNVCHTETGQHYRSDYGDGHNSGRICTSCHEHKWTDSHSSGKTCTTCHADKPVPRHTAFGLPRDCTKCHNGTIKGRMDIMGQFRANSHHVQADKVTNKHCYACHWEATEFGLINTDYHSGYNYKTYERASGREVDLVIWGPGERPTTYTDGTTAVTFTANKIGTIDERTEVSKITQVCLGCHSDQNKNTEPFSIVDPDHADCKKPIQYAWDKTSIASRYSQTGTATWGKYTTTSNAAKKDITKAFSGHGNAVANQGGWSATTGLDGTIPNTRNGLNNIQCYDCHSSHGSKAQGITSSYKTFNGTNNGANLKETQAGKGGYQMTYKPESNTDLNSVNPFNAGAGLCFDCHETAAAGAKPWGYNSTFGATEPVLGYKDTPRFGPGTKGSAVRSPFMANKPVIGGHMKASSSLTSPAMGTINGLCTPCHDPHGVSPTLGDRQQYALPMLKGTWLTSPYKEDIPPMDKDGYSGASGFYNYGNSWSGSYVRPYPQKSNPQPSGGWRTDRNTFNTKDLSVRTNLPDSTYGRISEDDSKFAGLCLRCHSKANLTDGINKNTAFKTKDRIHESVKGWGTNGEHSWPCAKCHQPHNSGLPRLLATNCLDYKHRGKVVSGGLPYAYDVGWSYENRYGRFPYGWWNTGFSDYSTAICHGAGTANGQSGWPDNQKWNSVTPW